MPSPAVGAPLLFHLGLEQVPPTAGQLAAYVRVEGPEFRPVAVVELLDELETPPTFDDVAADEFGPHPLGEFGVARRVEEVGGFPPDLKVAAAHELMERIEVTTGLLDGLECLGQFSESLDRRVVDTSGRMCSGAGRSRSVMVHSVPDRAGLRSIHPRSFRKLDRSCRYPSLYSNMISNQVGGGTIEARLTALDTAVDGLLGVDLSGLSNDDIVEVLQRMETSLRKATTVGHQLIVESTERMTPGHLG